MKDRKKAHPTCACTAGNQRAHERTAEIRPVTAALPVTGTDILHEIADTSGIPLRTVGTAVEGECGGTL